MYTREVPARELQRVRRRAFIKFYLRPKYLLGKMFTRPGELLARARLFLDFIR
jgi:hypothetical protein